MKILISGASVAGPVLAYWLARYGFSPTVVERAPFPRLGMGGHAVDLFAPGMQIAERMGIADTLRDAATGSTRLRVERIGKPAFHINHSALLDDAGTARHVEVMRGELARTLHASTRDDVEYVFDTSLTSLEENDDSVHVTLNKGRTRRFDLVIGADGLHSNVRQLVFGPEHEFRHYLGGYLAVFSVPNYRDLTDETVLHNMPGKLAVMYRVPGTEQARVVLLFRRAAEMHYDHRDIDEQKHLLRREFAGQGWEVPRLLAEIDYADDIYLDSVSQIRMASWSRGRASLVGDAAFSPGPAVGGGTTLAMVSAYMLAHALAETNGDHRQAFPAYEDRIRDYVIRCRNVAPKVLRGAIPRSRAHVTSNELGLRLLPWLPSALRRRVAARGAGKALSSFTLPD